jgi:hypothetical protein
MTAFPSRIQFGRNGPEATNPRPPIHGFGSEGDPPLSQRTLFNPLSTVSPQTPRKNYHTIMRGKALLIILAVCCLTSQAIPHGVDHEDVDNTSPSPSIHAVSTSAEANPTNTYVPPKDNVTENHHPDMDMGMDMDGMGEMEPNKTHHSIQDGPIPPEQMSYWLWPEHRGLLYTHIILMTVSWGFLLPLGALNSS